MAGETAQAAAVEVAVAEEVANATDSGVKVDEAPVAEAPAAEATPEA